jgi:hypothetical protein
MFFSIMYNELHQWDMMLYLYVMRRNMYAENTSDKSFACTFSLTSPLCRYWVCIYQFTFHCHHKMNILKWLFISIFLHLLFCSPRTYYWIDWSSFPLFTICRLNRTIGGRVNVPIPGYLWYAGDIVRCSLTHRRCACEDRPWGSIIYHYA